MRAIAFMVVLSLVLLSTVALADETGRLTAGTDVSDRAVADAPVSEGTKSEVPGLINYQGVLTDEFGVALDGVFSIDFAIYPTSVGGMAIWTETQPAVEVNHGLFNVLLGSVNPLSQAVFDDPNRWLAVKVAGDPWLDVRHQFTAVGYAFRAAGADTADYARSAPAATDGDWTISGIDMYSAVNGDVGIGTTNPLRKLDVRDVSGIGIYVENNDVDYAALYTRNFGGGHAARFQDGDVIVTNGKIGIGTITPTEKLDVVGTAQVTGLKMPTGASNGYVLTSDASGVGTWQLGFTGLWTDMGSWIEANNAAPFRIYDNVPGWLGLSFILDPQTSAVTNWYNEAETYYNNIRHLWYTDTEHRGLYARIQSDTTTDYGVDSYGEEYGGYFTSDGVAVRGEHSGGNYGYMGSVNYGAYGRHNASGNYGLIGTSSYGLYGYSSSGYGVYGSSSSGYGLRGYSSSGYGLYGQSSSGQGVYGYSTDNVGVRGSSSDSVGVYGYSTNDFGVYGEQASGNYGYMGSASVGVLGYGSTYGAYGYSGTYGVYGYNSGSMNYGHIASGSYGVYGYSSSGRGMYGSSSSGQGVYGYQSGSGNYGYLGGSAYGVFADLASTDVGDYAIYGYGTDASGEDGTDYGVYETLGGVKGYNYYGNPYTFGVAGYSYLDYNRSGGCFGGRDDAFIWGCLGYKNSSGTLYGGYATSWGSGTGKGQASTGIGFGSWGDLFGADIHGKIYGTYTEGGNYALYSNGDVFTNGMDVHLQETETPSMAVLYTNVSTDVTVQTSGFAALAGGKSSITFDENFTKAVSPEVPIVVTVTPTGPCEGVYVSEVTKDGFTVVENGAGKSDITVAFIAIGRRAGYEHPQLPAEVISSDYVDKLSRGLHNDADTDTDGEGLYFEDDQLWVGVHPSTLPDPQKPLEEPEKAEENRKLLEAQEQEKLERERMEQEARRIAEAPRTTPEALERERLEREREEQEARRIAEEDSKRVEAEKRPQPVRRVPSRGNISGETRNSSESR